MTTGWDPATDCGSINFTAFNALFMSLGNNLSIPTYAPIVQPSTRSPGAIVMPTQSMYKFD